MINARAGDLAGETLVQAARGGAGGASCEPAGSTSGAETTTGVRKVEVSPLDS